MKALYICIILLISAARPAWGQFEKIQELQKSLPAIRDSAQYVDVINRISLLFYEQNADSTLHYATLARQIALRQTYPKGVADATNNLGVVYDIKGNIQLALRYYNDAYNQYVSLADSSNIVQTLMNIAAVYSISGKDQKAVVNFDQALSLGNRIAHDSITALVIYNYILTYPQKFSADQKSAYIEKASGIAVKYKDVRLALAIDQLRADNMIANQDREKGMRLLEATMQKALNMQLYYLSMDLLIELGDHNFKDNEAKAIAFYMQALQIAGEKNYRMYARDICRKLYQIYSDRGDDSNAFIYSKRLLALNDEQQEIDRVSGIDYIEYAVKDQQLISAQLKSQYNSQMLWLAVAVCILTILSIIFLWRNGRLTRKTNQVLTMQFRQLESTTEALEKSNHNFARLIKVVAHDLRNPIGGINALSSLMQEDDITADEAREFIQLIHESSNSCLNLITDLLQTDFEFNEAELKKEPIDLAPFLKQAVTLLTFRANEKQQQLTLDDTTNATLTADRDKLLRVLNNLIVNAIKFTPDGGTIRVQAKGVGSGVEISIKDSGVGIPKESAARLFDPFTPSKREGTAGEQAFGLGLYISKQIVEAHGGRIWFESEEGRGTTFFVYLPEEKPLLSGPVKAIED
ncbi:tetratricopeptide repeat-containing sensor histidine kinase [Dyadobacter sp. MSC1_007]|jgi:signal transduction histidine kinase|uniref:tetratricopeptide repeat-containing sensor histidine kinase n=1 Tax=Dyadobacter sp. MSC1_007 TaxID=2909264 RepID=UPI00202DD003|nr:tetratricopeptide repeat-containing sensor histidine kinase [Dyadobacter sp. MSC1_007]